MSKWNPLVRRVESRYWPIEIGGVESGGEPLYLSWTEAARVMGELQQELEDHDREAQAQRELEARAAKMIADTATMPPAPAPSGWDVDLAITAENLERKINAMPGRMTGASS